MSGLSALENASTPQPKQMSSRLLTMKFMQRASNSTSTPATPASEPSSKRRKTAHTPNSSTATTPASERQVFASRSDIKTALQAELELERQTADQRTEFGHNIYESQWVLNVNFPPPSVGNSAHDDNDFTSSESEDDWVDNGRQLYGTSKRKKAPVANGSKVLDLQSDEESGEFSDDQEDTSDSQDDDDRHLETRKRNAVSTSVDSYDGAAMAALDRVDLTKSSYAKAKATMAPPFKRSFPTSEHRHKRRGDKHPKKQKPKYNNRN